VGLVLKTKTHFAFRVDIWDDTGDSIVEHVAGVDDFEGGGGDLPGSRSALASGAASPCDRASGWCMIAGDAPVLLAICRGRGGELRVFGAS
jgi:hypothetical protein